jgi:hypothetical protein
MLKVWEFQSILETIGEGRQFSSQQLISSSASYSPALFSDPPELLFISHLLEET